MSHASQDHGEGRHVRRCRQPQRGAGACGRVEVRSSVKAGTFILIDNHNEAQVRAAGLKVRSSVKAGVMVDNHNEAQVRAAGLKVRSSVKAGTFAAADNHNEAQVRAARR
jgi:hypothetical protein